MPAASSGSWTGYAVARKLCVIGAVGFLVAPVIAAFGKRLVRHKEQLKTDERIDKNLQDTFPASDPPAPHFTDIPVNRR